MSSFDFTITEDDIRALEVRSGLIFDAPRSNILRSLESIDVQACPGSGKTTLIAVKLILLSQKWKSERQGICVLSHTNVAKNETVRKLQTSGVPETQKLLTHPHFIGTIQEFVDKFLAIPLLRSIGIEVKQIDTDLCVQMLYQRLSWGTRSYIDKKNIRGNVLYDFPLKLVGSQFEFSVPTFKTTSQSDSYIDLLTTRKRLIREGYLFYSDMYVIAQKTIVDNQSLVAGLQKRFPFVFIDEMQDTQGFQDALLQKVFPLDSTHIAVQRFGDPDQAIFNGMNGEEPNQSYNAKPRGQFDFVIDSTHRFDISISQKIRGISYNAVNLQSELSEESIQERLSLHASGGPFKQTIFVFDDGTIKQVMPSFISLLKSQFNADHIAKYGLTAKVVGAVGKEVDSPSDLRIASYWEGYKKSQTNHAFEENSFLEAVLYCREHSLEHWSQHYHRLLNCVLKILRLLGRKDENGNWFSSTTLHLHLKSRNRLNQYRQIIYWFLNSTEQLTSQDWVDHTANLLTLLDIRGRPTYFAFSEVQSDPASQQMQTCPSNIYTVDELQLEVATIHGVKGETHDATLVLETKNHEYDVQTILNFLCADTSVAPIQRPETNSRKAKFMRQLYVAMSRSRYLVAFAVHKDHIQEQHIQNLKAANWYIHELQE